MLLVCDIYQALYSKRISVRVKPFDNTYHWKYNFQNFQHYFVFTMNRIAALQLTKWNNWNSFRAFSSISEAVIFQTTRKCLVHSERDGYVVKSPYKSREIPDLTIDRHVWNNLSKWSNHIAIECSGTGRKYTYAKLHDHCAALALRLRKH